MVKINKIKGSRIIILLALMLLFFIGVLELLKNTHTVTEGVVYRSAQLNPKNLSQLVKKEGIRSIINLRGVSEGNDWYDNEIDMARRLGVVHYDLNLSASKYVSPERIKAIISLIKEIPKPVLIHCYGGADRTGLVCAAWKYDAEHEKAEAAKRQLSIRYAHFPYLLWSDSIAMDKSFSDFVMKETQ